MSDLKQNLETENRSKKRKLQKPLNPGKIKLKAYLRQHGIETNFVAILPRSITIQCQEGDEYLTHCRDLLTTIDAKSISETKGLPRALKISGENNRAALLKLAAITEAELLSEPDKKLKLEPQSAATESDAASIALAKELQAIFNQQTAKECAPSFQLGPIDTNPLFNSTQGILLCCNAASEDTEPADIKPPVDFKTGSNSTTAPPVIPQENQDDAELDKIFNQAITPFLDKRAELLNTLSSYENKVDSADAATLSTMQEDMTDWNKRFLDNESMITDIINESANPEKYKKIHTLSVDPAKTQQRSDELANKISIAKRKYFPFPRHV